MKKLTAIFTAITLVVSLASCSKVCSCREKTNELLLPDIEISKFSKEYKSCSAYQDTLNKNDTAMHEWECSLK